MTYALVRETKTGKCGLEATNPSPARVLEGAQIDTDSTHNVA